MQAVIRFLRKEPKQNKKPHQRLDNIRRSVAYLPISTIPGSVVVGLLLKGENCSYHLP
jgi:hypothetical protein